jgi:SAM-dependent methyltransferase
MTFAISDAAREARGFPARAARLYHAAYDLICGKHPYQRPWHFQWLPMKDLRRDLRHALTRLPAHARLLDVGCGTSPYRAWLPGGVLYIGLDVEGVSGADIAFKPGEPWILPTESFDAVLCTQVLEHVADVDHILGEIVKCLKPGGMLIVAVPFIYQEHGTPHDFRRFSQYGLRNLLEPHFAIADLRLQGGTGSSIGMLLLNWLELVQSRNTVMKIVRALAFPLWILFCFIVNLICALLDLTDRKSFCYCNVMAVAHRK